MLRDSYVYEHWRPDKDEPFYVGKGRKRRANDMGGRSEHHKRVQRKLARLGMCVEVRLVAEGLTHNEALAFEIERIAFWKAAGVELVNRTPGGEGNVDPLPETRAKMRAAKLGRTLTEEHKAKIRSATKAALSTPEMRDRASRKSREVMARPEVKAKHSASQKARVRTKEHYEKVSAALKGRKLSPEHAAKTRAASLGRKQPREEIERRRAANTGKKRSPEFCAQMKALWTPEKRAMQAAITTERSASMNEVKKKKEEAKEKYLWFWD